MRIILALLLSFAVPGVALAIERCEPRRAVAPGLARLEAAMVADRFIAYNPTGLKVVDGNIAPATPESIRADLKALRPYFNALITYSARDGNEHVADIAAELGFKAVIVGLWSPSDTVEIRNAIAMARAHPGLVVGFSLGNEIVLGERGTWDMLRANVALMRARAPDIPLTVGEPFAQFLDDDALAVVRSMDFMAVNIHPIFEPWFAEAGPFNWADFVVKVTDKLRARFCGPILVKETGLPSAPLNRGFDPEKQAAFWRELEKQMKPSKDLAFAYFSAFDAPWRVSDFNPMGDNHPEEAYWGFFDENRKPKPVLDGLPKLKD
jgi:exo-beta-1,3-glucanase (GH17 family)